MKKDIKSPKEFFRERHPEQFLEKRKTKDIKLSRSELEYFLNTITNRQEHFLFEDFARKIAEKEICPNLKPQTGPSGGGDSKVDTETYPVADKLSLTWFEGIGREAAKERWAFAISATKNWSGKVISDIEKIIKTDREYKKAFFITNQFVKDKTRGEKEDSLSSEYDIDIRILDREWLLDKVYENDYREVAIKNLNLDIEIGEREQISLNDKKKKEALSKLESKIQNLSGEKEVTPIIGNYCIKTAILARELEMPRKKIKGYFERAENIIDEYGTESQLIKIIYQKAWTLFWWFEDYQNFYAVYKRYEKLIEGSYKIVNIEKLFNLWLLLNSIPERDDSNYNLDKHQDILLSELDKIEKQKNMPSASLQAKGLRLLVEIQLEISQNSNLKEIFKELENLIDNCEGLVGFDLNLMADTIIELGNYFDDNNGYDELYETMIKAISSREEEINTAKLLMKRATQKLKKNKTDKAYDSITLLGRALNRLYKYESRDEFMYSLYLIGLAYERVGLYWAARNSLLMSASISLKDYWKYDEVDELQYRTLNQLKWLELRLGRLPHLLYLHEIGLYIKKMLIDKGKTDKELKDYTEDFDILLCSLLLKSGLRELEVMEELPEKLEEMGLINSSTGLLYALGYGEKIKKEIQESEIEDKEKSISETFIELLNKDFNNQLPSTLYTYQKQNITLESNILGCNFKINCVNKKRTILLAESIIGGLESFFSTAISKDIIITEPELFININESDFTKKPFRFEINSDLENPTIDVYCYKFKLDDLTSTLQNEIKNKIKDLIIEIFSRVSFIKGTEVIDELIRNEEALDKSINFTNSFVHSYNIYGENVIPDISSLLENDYKKYKLNVNKPWYKKIDYSIKKKESQEKQIMETIKSQKQKDKITSIKHSDIYTNDIISPRLWEKANWKGVGYLLTPFGDYPPTIFIVFDNEKYGVKIFNKWRKSIGKVDNSNRIRLSIIKSINKQYPNYYRVIIGANPKIEDFPNENNVNIYMSRIHTLQPNNLKNLNEFHRLFDEHNCYYLSLTAVNNGRISKELINEYRIKKDKVNIMEAWEVQKNSIESTGIFEKDDPIIPENKKMDAPVLEIIDT